MSTNQILLDIHSFISASLNDDLTEAERQSLRFNNGMDIIETIDEHFNNDNITIIEDFDPFTDPDTKALLGLAGINVHGRHK